MSLIYCIIPALIENVRSKIQRDFQTETPHDNLTHMRRILFFLIFLSLALFLTPKDSLFYIARLPALELIIRDEPNLDGEWTLVLLGGERTDRTDLAARIWKKRTEENSSMKIAFCDGFHPKNSFFFPDFERWEPRGDEYAAQLMIAGVPEESLIQIDCKGAYDTDTELTQLSAFLRSEGADSVNIATSASHSRRVHIIWHRLVPDIQAHIVGAPDFHFDSWWREKRSIRVLAYEYGALMKELFRQAVTIATERGDRSDDE
jgi:hypothetical protein